MLPFVEHLKYNDNLHVSTILMPKKKMARSFAFLAIYQSGTYLHAGMKMQVKVDLSNSPVVSGICFLSTAVALPYIELLRFSSPC